MYTHIYGRNDPNQTLYIIVIPITFPQVLKKIKLILQVGCMNHIQTQSRHISDKMQLTKHNNNHMTFQMRYNQPSITTITFASPNAKTIITLWLRCTQFFKVYISNITFGLVLNIFNKIPLQGHLWYLTLPFELEIILTFPTRKRLIIRRWYTKRSN